MPKENIIITWLRKLFKIQRISVIITFIAAIISFFGTYFTIKAYYESKSGELSYFHYDYDDNSDSYVTKDASNITQYWNLLITDIPFIQTNIHTKIRIGQVLCLPFVCNNSSKSLEHFKCKLHIWFDKELHDSFESSISGKKSELNILGKEHEFKVVEFSDYTLDLEYDDNFLPAGAYIPEPFRELLIPEVLQEKGAQIKLDYYITYDGIDKPFIFSVYSKIYVTDNFNDGNYIGPIITDFIENDIYSESNERNAKDVDIWAFTINNHFFRDIRHTKPNNVTEWNKEAIQQLVILK